MHYYFPLSVASCAEVTSIYSLIMQDDNRKAICLYVPSIVKDLDNPD